MYKPTKEEQLNLVSFVETHPLIKYIYTLAMLINYCYMFELGSLGIIYILKKVHVNGIVLQLVI